MLPPIMQAKNPIAENERRGQFLIYMQQPVFAELITVATSVNCVHAATYDDALEAIDEYALDGLIAMSPKEQPGSAGKVIKAFREEFPKAVTVYHGWDYRLEVSGQWALTYNADALIVGGVVANEFLRFLQKAVVMKWKNLPNPPSLAYYESLLHETCPKSDFWKAAQEHQEKGVPPSESY